MPGVSKVWEKVSPEATCATSKLPSKAATLCQSAPLLIQVTVWPALIVSEAGVKRSSSIASQTTLPSSATVVAVGCAGSPVVAVGTGVQMAAGSPVGVVVAVVPADGEALGVPWSPC